MKKNSHRGSSLNEFLEEEDLLEDFRSIVAKEAIARQLQEAMKERKLSKKRLAELMETSRTQVDRILDPTSGNVTLETLQRAANFVGRRLKLELV